MIEQAAVVAGISAEGHRLVQHSQNTACGGCCTMCPSAALPPVSAPHPDLKNGSSIRVDMSATALLQLTLQLYLIPVLTLLAGAVAGHVIADMMDWNDDGISVLGGISGLLSAIAILRHSLQARNETGLKVLAQYY